MPSVSQSWPFFCVSVKFSILFSVSVSAKKEAIVTVPLYLHGSSTVYGEPDIDLILLLRKV